MVLNRRCSLSILILLVFTACSAETNQVLPVSIDDDIGLPPSTLPVPVPEKILSICLGEEPASLFLYGDQSTSARIIRQALYDGPIDQVGNQSISVLLEEIPSQENDLVLLTQVQVFPGEAIIDARGSHTILANGTVYKPAGCADQDCWEVFDNQPSVLLDQVKITYHIKSGINWSDGTPVKATDSLFSYQAAAGVYGSGGPLNLRYTRSYEVGENGEILWSGLPGYQGIFSYVDFFFSPLPEHLWKNLTREELLTSTQSAQLPIGWGAYKITEWVRGDHITLIPNESYHLIAEGLPAFDALVFRFVDGGEEALAAFSAGECQIVANEPDLLNYQSDLIQSESDGLLNIYTNEGLAWEQISFGIDSRDSKLDLLQDQSLRQAMAGCINREKISTVRLDAGTVVDDFFLPGISVLEDIEPSYLFNIAESGLLLKEMGWLDHDGDSETPRLAEGVDDVPDGTVLQFTLLAAETVEKQITLSLVKEGLNSCGIGLEIELLPASEFLAPGPDGPVFGRHFDLAYFSWGTGNYQPCRLFLTDEIPGLYPIFPKGWGGVNSPGYSNEDFDSACRVASTTLPDSKEFLNSQEQLRTIFREDLPVLPLFYRRELIISDPDLIGLENGTFPLFWNIETIQ